MKILIIKTSSMGDVLHTLPALTATGKIYPDVTFDWVVEEALAEIPAWHPLVRRVITVPWRRIRKKPFSRDFFKEIARFKSQLQDTYDYVIDAQGLLKSAVMSWWARGVRCGGDFKSAREPLASLFYQKRCSIEKNQHAITRMKKLFASALNYVYVPSIADYGIHLKTAPSSTPPYVIFLHGTTWPTKHWPEMYWCALAKQVSEQGLQVKLLWGNEHEKARAVRISQAASGVHVMPTMTLREIADLLANAVAVVAIDTGFAHLAAALSTPTVSLYGPTDPVLTGAEGKNQIQVRSHFACAPCFQERCSWVGKKEKDPPCFTEITPSIVAEKLASLGWRR